jgi:small nuclear ribonucleoprotein (snRNP)-like protein
LQRVVVELRNESEIRGRLDHVDLDMTCERA